MSDPIERQDAIDVVAKALKGIFVEYQDVAEKIINKVPSAQPSVSKKEMVGDVISRQAAIKNYQRVCRKVACNDCPFLIRVTETLTDCELERFLHGLPSAQPERFNPCTVCQEFDCTGCKFRRAK